MGFRVLTEFRHGPARTGELDTAHGTIATPVFMPVGTRGSVKAVSPRELIELECPIILGNTYHLSLRPGLDVIKATGGLHAFMGWSRPILTDSGGYQVFSLAKCRRLTDAGAEFQSHIDGAAMFLGPNEAIAIQQALGSDIAMVFDECAPYPCDEDAARLAVERTLRWSRQCREIVSRPGQQLFGIVQGAHHRHLRERCAHVLCGMAFDGYAIGGVSVGEPESEMFDVLDWVAPLLPWDRPRYVMGVGTPPQIIQAVRRGIDMFDCVLPTRVGRNGCAYTADGMIQVKAGRMKNDFTPIEKGCGCYACTHFTRAYIRHLLNVGEILGLRLLTLHNLYFYQQLMRGIRSSIELHAFDVFCRDFLSRYRLPRRI